jgi:ribosome-interacting GTPase 1
LQEPADLKRIEEAIDNSLSYKKAVCFWLYNNENFSYNNIDVIGINPDETKKIKDLIYKDLDLIIVYTRKPGKKMKIISLLFYKKVQQ